MYQIIQDVRSGVNSVEIVAAPSLSMREILVEVKASTISAGTERFVVELARKSLLGKARARPADVRRVLAKARREGLRSTLLQVGAKLAEPMTLGYSAAGVVLEAGHDSMGFAPGGRVAVAAPHAAVVAVGRNACAHIPDSVSFEQAAYTSIAAIGLQGVRLAKLGIGENVLVIGLGLIGQMCVAMLKAHGCRVFGTDVDAGRLALARDMGADAVALGAPLQAGRDFTGGVGFDAALLTVATDSNEPIEFAAEACRVKGRIVLVGVTGLQIPRAPFFKKELEFTVSSSLGPGRSDPSYEEKGIDFPVGHVRWTMQRNMQAALQLMAEGKLPVEKLTTHRFQVERAPEAYDLILERKKPFLGIVLEYPRLTETPSRRIDLRPSASAPPAPGAVGVSLIGAGNFARLVMLPALSKSAQITWRGVCAARGIGAQSTAKRYAFAFAATDVTEIYGDDATQAVFVATRHNLHAGMVIAALRAGKHVFVEKPLCITEEELEAITNCVRELRDSCPIVMVGFNRRFAPATLKLRDFFTESTPLSISHRFSVPYLPPDHWTQDPEVGGGRIIGEACHAIDTCTAIAASPPVQVFAESTAKVRGAETPDDRVFITLKHENGAVSSVSYQSGGDAAFPAERIEVFGGGRSAVVDSWEKGELWLGGKRTGFSAGRDKGHRQGFEAFLETCRKGGAWPIQWQQIEAVTWAALAAVRSLREGQPIAR